MEMATGKFLIDSNTKVAGDASLEKEGQLLADMLGAASNENIEFSTEEKNGNIVLKLDPAIENEEGYVLSVKYDEIIISGKTSRKNIKRCFLWNSNLKTVDACGNRIRRRFFNRIDNSCSYC
jgi:hypothetical protein